MDFRSYFLTSRRRAAWRVLGLVLAGSALLVQEGEARPWRPLRIPNGTVNSCSNCHINPLGGGPKTPFGNDVLTALLGPPLIPTGSSEPEPFWGPALAALDSDGDGFSNGVELGDPLGLWQVGDPNPGDPALVSLPGDPTSVPPLPTPTPSPTPGGGDDTFLQAFDFRDPAASAGWISGALPGGFGGTVAQDASRGLCMTVGGPGDNIVLWISPPNMVPLIDGLVYRARVRLNTDQMDADAIPLFNFVYQNQQADFFATYGGERWIWDATNHGGANGIGRAQGRGEFEFFFAPLAADLPQWRAANDAGSTAFDPEADAVNDMRLTFRVLDVGGGADTLVATEDSGTICVESVTISTLPIATLRANATNVYSPPLDDGSNAPGIEDFTSLARTHFPQTFANAGLFPNVTADIQDGEWNVRLPPIDATNDPAGAGFMRATLGPDVVAAGDIFVGGLQNPPRLFPILWESDALYMIRAPMRSNVGGGSEGTNPVDLIILNYQTFTAELGGLDFVTSGVDRNAAAAGDGGGMLRAGSPRLAATTGGVVPEYLAFFHGANATVSLIESAGLWKAQIDLFNRADLGGGAASGTDPLTATGFLVDRIDGLNLSGG